MRRDRKVVKVKWCSKKPKQNPGRENTDSRLIGGRARQGEGEMTRLGRENMRCQVAADNHRTWFRGQKVNLTGTNDAGLNVRVREVETRMVLLAWYMSAR